MTEFSAKDNWEALFDRSYLRWFHLNDSPALCEIVKVEKDVELVMRGGLKSKKPVLTLKQVQGNIEEIKPLVLNRTNTAIIAHIHGNRPSQWVGKQIVLYPDTTKMFDNDLKKNIDVGCIRIRAKK